MQVRCWEVQQSGTVIPKAQQTHTGPVLDVAWSDVSSWIPTILSWLTSADKYYNALRKKAVKYKISYPFTSC